MGCPSARVGSGLPEAGKSGRADAGIPRRERRPEDPRGGDDQAVGGIAVKVLGIAAGQGLGSPSTSAWERLRSGISMGRFA